MARRPYKPTEQAQSNHFVDTQLPINRPIAIYYRQSTDAQVGNVSTTVQTVDMVNYLKKLGWSDENITMIDMDGGVSGTKKIDERPGMSMLYGLITDGKISAVACQDEDRLFRDVTQIQVNIFIEACKNNNVLVITPSVVYNFAHPQMGTFHARQFRFKSEMAAEYINSVIMGKLHSAKRSLQFAGKWSGSSMAVGYMVDMRKKLPDGNNNPHYRKFVPFEPYAEVLKAYFDIFVSYSGNLYKTVRHIGNKGPYFPDPKTCLPPEGFRIFYKIRQYKNGFYPKCTTSLDRIFTNAVYLGHWVAKGSIVVWNSHQAIVDEETFHKAFNYISKVTLTGEDNPSYPSSNLAFRPRNDKNRSEAEPILSGLIYGKIDDRWQTVKTHWRNEDNQYRYVLPLDDGTRFPLWTKKSSYFDSCVASLLIDKLKMSFDLSEWEQSVKDSFAKYIDQKRLIEAQLQNLTTITDNLLTSLGTLSNKQMIAAVEQRYQDASQEKDRLQKELELVIANTHDTKKLADMQASFKETIEQWDKLGSDQKRTVVRAFITKIEATALPNDELDVVIYWKEGSKDKLHLRHVAAQGTIWLPQQTDLLINLVESGASKVEIAKAFPDLMWRAIYHRYYYITGKKIPREKKNTLMKYETYNEYIKRIEIGRSSDTNEVDSSGSPRWKAGQSSRALGAAS